MIIIIFATVVLFAFLSSSFSADSAFSVVSPSYSIVLLFQMKSAIFLYEQIVLDSSEHFLFRLGGFDDQ